MYLASTATALSTVSMIAVTATNVKSLLSGSMVYSATSSVSISAASSTFQCLISAYTTNDPQLTAQTSTIGGAFWVQNAVKVTSTANTIKWCYIGDTGGAFYIENSMLTDSGGSTFSYNAAVTGGAITCKSCSKIDLTQSTFTYHEAYKGGLIYLDSPTIVNLDSVTV